jgi:hypothetical protein
MIVVSEYLHVADRAAELGLRLTDEIVVMPDNFATAPSPEAFVHRPGGASVQLLLEGRIVGRMSHDARHAMGGSEEDWHVTLFAPSRLAKLAPDRLAAALGEIAAHLGGIAKAFPHRQINLCLIVERGSDGSCKRLTYEGDVSSLGPLLDKALAIAGE